MAGLIKFKWDHMHDEHLEQEQEQMPHVPTIRNLLQDSFLFDGFNIVLVMMF